MGGLVRQWLRTFKKTDREQNLSCQSIGGGFDITETRSDRARDQP